MKCACSCLLKVKCVISLPPTKNLMPKEAQKAMSEVSNDSLHALITLQPKIYSSFDANT